MSQSRSTLQAKVVQTIAALLLGLFWAGIPLKATAQTDPQAMVRINMNNADVRTVIKWVAEQTQKNYIIDPRVKGKLSVLSSKPMSMEDAYQVFLTAMDVYGFAVVESGNNVKVIPNAQARSSGLPVVQAFNAADEDDADLVIHVIKIVNLKAAEVVTLLRPLVPQTGHLGAFPGSNSIIVADRANNIVRLSNLIKQLDENSDLDIEIIPMEYATAEDIIKVIEPLMKSGNAQATVQFASDERSNSILMTGSSEARDSVRDLIASLDRPLQGSGNTKVIYLNYIEATEVEGILTGMTSTITDEQKDSNITQDSINIQASETTNALVITAPPSVLETMEQIIAELDIRRSQVMIDAVIVEVSDSFSRDIEVLWATNTVSEPPLRGGVTSANLASTTTSALVGGDNPQANFLQSGFNWGFYRNGTLRSLLRAIETDNESNVLSRPSIITLDNEEAEVLVGSNVPFVTGSATSTSGDINNPFQTITREDIGITLKITPKVSKNESITLDIEQEVESVRAEQIADAQDLVTDKRSIKTQVLIENKSILVLGGLLEDRMTISHSKIPLLGDIPLLGRLFRGSSKELRKQNLMVFIKPTILDDPESQESLNRDRYESIRSKQNQKSSRTLTLPEFSELYDSPETAPYDSTPASVMEDLSEEPSTAAPQ